MYSSRKRNRKLPKQSPKRKQLSKLEAEENEKKAVIIAARRPKAILEAISKAEAILEAEVESEIRAKSESVSKELKSEDDWYLFKYPKATNTIEHEMIRKEKIYRDLYKVKAKKETNSRISSIYKLYTDADRILVFYSADSINRKIATYPTPYSIEIHCTTFKPPNSLNDKFYGHVSLRIYRGDPTNPEIYHYGVFVPDNNIITDFTRKFWSNTRFNPYTVPLNTIKDLSILFPNKSAATLMKDYYKLCIKFCPKAKPKMAARNQGTYALLTEWGL